MREQKLFSPILKKHFQNEHQVIGGETVWTIIETILNQKNRIVGLGEEEKTHIIDFYTDKFRKMSPGQLKTLGFSSGDVNIIHVGELLNLSTILDDNPVASEPTSQKTKKGLSRREFIKKALKTGALAIGATLLSKSIGLEENSVIKEETSHRPIEESAEAEIQKCADLITNERYEEILKNPCIVSALYYSEQAIKKMAPPHKHRTEEIIWNIYPLITKKFRENYINTLNKMIAGKSTKIQQERLVMQSRPLDTVSFGKNLGENHVDAIDLFIKEGSPIYSITEGIVVAAENHWIEDNDMSTSSHRGGNTVIVFNPHDESFYRYAHMKEAKTTPGTILVSGQQIGIVGHTGINAAQEGHGEHLHLEINGYDRKHGGMIPYTVFELKRKLEKIQSSNS